MSADWVGSNVTGGVVSATTSVPPVASGGASVVVVVVSPGAAVVVVPGAAVVVVALVAAVVVVVLSSVELQAATIKVNTRSSPIRGRFMGTSSGPLANSPTLPVGRFADSTRLPGSYW
jgi:hypothetical protein